MRASSPSNAPPLPSPAKPPTAEQLQAMQKQVQGLKGEMPVGGGAYLGEDWQTEGDAIGHYGRQYARLFAIASPLDQILTWHLATEYDTDAQMGPHRREGDSLRHWISFSHTQNRNALYSPVDGFRTQAEIDDHGETYAGGGFGGPDIWLTVSVPEGVHRVSLYFYNKDGHEGPNRYRDYLVELKKFRPSPEDVERAPAIASARVRDFAGGGVYKSFVVRGPSKYYIKIGKNNSFNTICSAVFIDKLTGPYPASDAELPFMAGLQFDAPSYAAPSATNGGDMENEALRFWASLDKTFSTSSNFSLLTSYQILAYRSLPETSSDALKANWRWHTHLWTQRDRDRFESFTVLLTRASKEPFQQGVSFRKF